MVDTIQTFKNINQLTFVDKDTNPIVIFHDDADITKHDKQELVIHFTDTKILRDLINNYATTHTS